MSSIIRSNIFIFFFLVFSVQGIAQNYKSGPQVLSFFSDVDDTDQPYAIYIPKNYNPAQKYPFVVMLHGAGSNHRLALRRVFGKSNENGETDVEASQYFPPWNQKDVIVAAPFARGTLGYQGIPEKDVYDMMDDVKRRFNIDEDRTYLTGLSMGGGGTLWLGLTKPDVWAAIVPVCPAPPLHTNDLIDNALNLPVFFHHGDADEVVSTDISRNFVKEMKAKAMDVSYKEYPKVGHDAWVPAYDNAEIFDWMLKHKRNLYPDRLTFVAKSYKYSKAYWLTVDNFEVDKYGKIEASFSDENKLVIKTKSVNGFSIDIRNHPKFNPGKKLRIDFDSGQSLRFSTKGKERLFRNNNDWGIEVEKSTDFRKAKGAEGPMENVISERHVYVYGTADNPSREELERRKKQAETAAFWSYYRGEFLGRIKVFPRVLKDTEIRKSDLETSNLILFGDKQTNALIDQYNDQLPIHLLDRENYGLAYLFPIGERYVLINSGLSILDAPDSQKEWDWSSRYASTDFILSLRKFDDFVLYSKDEVIVQGIFDNHWKLKPEDRKILEANQVVQCKMQNQTENK